MAKVLSKVNQTFSGQIPPLHTKYGDFVAKAKRLILQAGECLSSYDVTSLFTSVPIDPALNIIKDLLEKDEELKWQNSIIGSEHHRNCWGSVCIILTFLFKTSFMNRLRVHLWDHLSVQLLLPNCTWKVLRERLSVLLSTPQGMVQVCGWHMGHPKTGT